MTAKSKKPTIRDKASDKSFIIKGAITLLGVALLELLLAGSYLAALHAPKAHNLPIAVVGQASQVQPLVSALNNKSKGAYKASIVTSQDDAINQLKKQQVYAIYTPKVPVSTITIASANSKVLATSIPISLTVIDKGYQQQVRALLAQSSATAVAAKTPITSPTIKDIAKLDVNDPNGIGMFYVAFACVFGGYLAATALNLIRGKKEFTRRNAWIRTLGFLSFSIVTSIFIGLIATHGVSVIPVANYWEIVGIAALTTFGVAMLASALISILGTVGTALVIVLFVILGTPASGGPAALTLTGSGPWHWFAPVLPTGASLGTIRQSVYFGGSDLMAHLWVLIGYAIIGTVTLLAIAKPKSTVSFYEDNIIEDAKTADERPKHKARLGSRAGE